MVTQGRIITEVNKGLLEMFGYSTEELVGQSVGMIHVDQDSYREFGENYWAETAQRKAFTAQWRLRRKNGEIFWCELTGSAINSLDIWQGVVWVLIDISERRRLQEAIVQSEKMMSVGGLAAGMAHEINNPLGGILQSAQVLAARLREELPANLRQAREAGCDFQAMRDYMERRGVFALLDAIRESAVRAAKIVANMLDFSRRGSIDFVPEDVNAIISGALDLASNDYDLLKKYDFRTIRIDKDLDPSLPPVKCSPIEIEQVILNLLKNAAHALASRSDPSKAPAIRLHTCLKGDHVVIEVADNGPGMEPAVLRHVFEPFFTTKEPGLGTGLGLSVSYFIVTSHHNGSIEVESELGAGAKFIIRLPV